jgi:hypothetical protein
MADDPFSPWLPTYYVEDWDQLYVYDPEIGLFRPTKEVELRKRILDLIETINNSNTPTDEEGNEIEVPGRKKKLRWTKNLELAFIDVFKAYNSRKSTDFNPPEWLGCLNGDLDVRRMILYSHSPDHMLTWQFQAEFLFTYQDFALQTALLNTPDEDLETEVGKNLLAFAAKEIRDWQSPETPCFDRVFQLNPGPVTVFEMFMRNLVRKRFQNDFTFLAVGPPAGGKSTMTDLVSQLLGHEHCSSLDFLTIGHQSDFAMEQFVGKIANLCQDMAIGMWSPAAVQVFKSVAVGDTIPIYRKFKPPIMVRFNPFYAFNVANQLPQLPPTDASAVFRRLIAVECLNTPDRIDPTVRPGVLKEINTLFTHWVLMGPTAYIDPAHFSVSDHSQRVRQIWEKWADPPGYAVKQICSYEFGHQENIDVVMDLVCGWLDQFGFSMPTERALIYSVHQAIRRMRGLKKKKTVDHVTQEFFLHIRINEEFLNLSKVILPEEEDAPAEACILEEEDLPDLDAPDSNRTAQLVADIAETTREGGFPGGGPTLEDLEDLFQIYHTKPEVRQAVRLAQKMGLIRPDPEDNHDTFIATCVPLKPVAGLVPEFEAGPRADESDI